MPQLTLNGTGDCADHIAAAIFEAKKQRGPLFRDDIAAICRPLVEAEVGLRVAAASPKAKKQREALAHSIPPEPQWVTDYSAEIGYPMDGQKWCDAYAAKGWIVSGKAKMKDWKAAVRNWKSNGWGQDNRIALRKTKDASRNDARYKEPEGDWRATARHLFGLDALPAQWSTWFDVPLDYREKIARAHQPQPT